MRKNIIKIFLFLNLLCLTGASHAQSGKDKKDFITFDEKGNVYVLGEAQGGYSVQKFNSSGAREWNTVYRNQFRFNFIARSIAADKDGNLFIAGSLIINPQNTDMAVVKLNMFGVEQWGGRYSTPGNVFDNAEYVTTDNLGNIFVTGSSGNDILTIRYDISGNESWVKRYSAGGNGTSYKMALDIFKNLYVIGTFNNDFITLKYDISGRLQWASKYNGVTKGIDIARDLFIDGTGNVIVTGESFSSITGSEFVTIKYSSLGNEQWVKRFTDPGSSSNKPASVTADEDGNIYVTGTSYLYKVSSSIVTVKYNKFGIDQWVRKYKKDGDTYNDAYTISTDNSGNVIAAGETSEQERKYEYPVIKYNASSGEQVVNVYKGTGNNNDAAYAISQDNAGTVYLTGSSIESRYGTDYSIIKVYPGSGIEQILGETPASFSLHQNYPDPVRNSTSINFDLPVKTNVKLSVFDPNGKEIEKLVDSEIGPGIFSIKWDAGKYTKGIYFYKLTTKNFSDSKKMVVGG